MARNVRLVLQEILTAIEGIEAAVKDKTFADFQNEWLLRHGIQRGIHIRGEPSCSSYAARHPSRNTLGPGKGDRQRIAGRLTEAALSGS